MDELVSLTLIVFACMLIFFVWLVAVAACPQSWINWFAGPEKKRRNQEEEEYDDDEYEEEKDQYTKAAVSQPPSLPTVEEITEMSVMVNDQRQQQQQGQRIPTIPSVVSVETSVGNISVRTEPSCTTAHLSTSTASGETRLVNTSAVW